jgi:alkylation response protein AidB-like acyl-CoA dehydrogenase
MESALEYEQKEKTFCCQVGKGGRMDVIPHDEYKVIDESVSKFVQRELAPHWKEYDRYPFGEFCDHVVEQAFQAGYLTVNLAEDLGGMGRSIAPLCRILKTICEEDASVGGIILATAVAQEIILQAGMESILENIVSDTQEARDIAIACPLFTNPIENQPDVSAEKNDNKYLLTGSTGYVVLGGLAKQGILSACIPGQKAPAYFLINLSDRGVSLSDPIFSLGLHACPVADVTLDHAEGVLMGEEGKGNVYFQKMYDRMDVVAASMSAGIMKGSFMQALTYSEERTQGGRRIIEWSELRGILSRMAREVRVAEMLIEHACLMADQEYPHWEEACHAAAMHILDVSPKVTTDGIQVLGGYGYMKEFHQEKRFRDAHHLQTIFGIPSMNQLRYMDYLR